MIILSPALFILSFFLDLAYTTSIPADATSVATFYAPNPRYDNQHVALLMFQAFLFGALHILGYPFTRFPTFFEKKLWFIASLAITLVPLVMSSILILVMSIFAAVYHPTSVQKRSGPEHWLPPKVYKRFNFGRRFLQIIFLFAYVAARVIILVVAVGLLRRQPDDVFRVLDWTNLDFRKSQWIKYIPHFS